MGGIPQTDGSCGPTTAVRALKSLRPGGRALGPFGVSPTFPVPPNHPASAYTKTGMRSFAAVWFLTDLTTYNGFSKTLTVSS